MGSKLFVSQKAAAKSHLSKSHLSKYTVAALAGLTTALMNNASAIAGELTIATVNNGHMVEMQKLTPEFELSLIHI